MSDVISVVEPEFNIISEGIQGPAGARGLQGPAGGSQEYVSPGTFSGHRVLRIDAAGVIGYASNLVAVDGGRVIGMTTGAVVAGAPLIPVERGEVTEPSWNWNTALPVWLGIDGHLTQVEPVSPAVFSLIVGYPTATNKLFLAFREPIYLN